MDSNINQKSSEDWWNSDQQSKWEDYYYKEDFQGLRLKAREQKVIKFLDSLNMPQKSKILELGFGAGITSAKIIRKGYYLHGIDISETLCKIARKNCYKVTNTEGKFSLNVGDAKNLQFKDDYFDVVFGIGFLQYMESPLQCLREAKRVLKRGGYFIIGQENLYGLHYLDNPFGLFKVIYTIITGGKYEFYIRNTFILNWILFIAIIFNLKSKKKLRLIKKTKLPRKNLITPKRLRFLIKKAGFTICRCGAGGFYSNYSILPRKLSLKLQKWSDSKKRPFSFGNAVIFLAKK
ncbi:class I SAM-dependent methyltransferase [Candidatus Woesearchaeota archaeon]|jgi:ubiquinone/menaquinone biosynthesis C-methylase UbiE|nr:class I SAM-dependent methyltransferase [Candidatus Woesearchaeota archaeon]MBT5342132.1 class I SAM-dependent methyltransferase [Candidatus Woesearchaeota archaeon]